MDAPEVIEQARGFFQEAYRFQMQGKLDEAIRLYTRSLELHPTAEAYTFRGWTYSYKGELDTAIEDCRHAIEVDPDFGNPYNDIGAYLIQRGDLDGAIPWLEKALAAPRYRSYEFAHANLGRAYEAKGDWRRALDAYKAALKENPKYETAAQALGRLRGMLN